MRTGRVARRIPAAAAARRADGTSAVRPCRQDTVTASRPDVPRPGGCDARRTRGAPRPGGAEVARRVCALLRRDVRRDVVGDLCVRVRERAQAGRLQLGADRVEVESGAAELRGVVDVGQREGEVQHTVRGDPTADGALPGPRAVRLWWCERSRLPGSPRWRPRADTTARGRSSSRARAAVLECIRRCPCGPPASIVLGRARSGLVRHRMSSPAPARTPPGRAATASAARAPPTAAVDRPTPRRAGRERDAAESGSSRDRRARDMRRGRDPQVRARSAPPHRLTGRTRRN
jgi:hypothetical protein